MKAAIDNVRLAPECNNMLMGPENVAESGRPDIGTFFPNLAPHIKMSCLPCQCISQRASPSQTLRRSFETAPFRRQNVPNSGRSSGRGSTTITACNPVKGSSARQRQIMHRYCTERTGTSARSVGSNAMCPSLTSCCRACRCPHVGRHCCRPTLNRPRVSHRPSPSPWVERAHRSGGPQDRCKLDGSREAEVWWGRWAQLGLFLKSPYSTVQYSDGEITNR